MNKVHLKAAVKIAAIMTAMSSIFFVDAALAASVTVSGIASTIGKTVGSFAKILSAVSVISGLGFILASFFKFHQHKLNPTQVPLSQGITLLLIGSGLAVLPALIPATTKAVFGTAEIASVTGSALGSLIGS